MWRGYLVRQHSIRADRVHASSSMEFRGPDSGAKCLRVWYESDAGNRDICINSSSTFLPRLERSLVTSSVRVCAMPDPKPYLDYLDKEMTIMGILSTFCLGIPVVLVERVEI